MFASKNHSFGMLNRYFWISLTAIFCLFFPAFTEAQTTVSPASVAFGNVVTGEPSAIHAVTLKNTGTATITISGISVSGAGFAIDSSSTCSTILGNPGNSLTHNATCTIALTLTPAGLGAVTPGALGITTTAPNVLPPLTLTGTGIAPTSLSPASLNFGSVAVGSTSTVQKVTIKNNQLRPLVLQSLLLPNPAYAQDPSTTCGNLGSFPATLSAGATCTIALTFKPTSLGAIPAGALTISTDASNSPQSVALAGTGIAPTTLSAGSISFGNVAVSEASAIHSFTLKNNQSITLVIQSVVLPDPAYALAPSTTCFTLGSLPASIAAGATCTIAVTVKPSAVGAIPPGSLTIATNASNSPQSVALSGTGVTPTTLSATSVAFGSVAVGEKGAIHAFSLKNNQLAPLTLGISSITPPAGGYAVDPSSTCGTTLAGGASCSIALTLTPASLGAVAPGSLSIVTTNPGQTLSVALSGAGIAPTTISATSVAFGSVVVLEPSATKTVTVKNNQLIPLHFSSPPSTSGSEFALVAPILPAIPCSNATPLAPGMTCAIPIILTPSGAPSGLGAQTSTLTIVSDAGGTQTVALSGTGISPVTVSPTSLSFAAQLVGTTSTPAKIVTLKNVQPVNTLHFVGASITGNNSGDFAWTSTGPNACGSVAPGASCQVVVTFTPSLSGTRTAALNISDDTSPTPHTIALTGAGNAPVSASPTSITSFTAPVGSTSTAQTVTIKNNNASDPIVISSFQITGDFKQTSTSCGVPAAPPNLPPYTLAAGASCNLTVQFAPTIGGTRTGQLQINDSALTSPQVINLSGSGTSPLTVLPASLTFPAQPNGTVSPSKNITLTNHEAQSETFSLAPIGDFTVVANNCPSGTISANSSCILSLAFAPSATAPSGADSGSLKITNSAAVGSPLTVPLTGSVGAQQAAVAQVTPGTGAAGTSSLSVVITGNGYTHFSASSVISFVDTNSASYPSDITVASFTANSPNQITAILNLGTPATNSGYGARNITVKTGTETAFLNSAFTIYDPTDVHTITVVNPAFGTQGQTLNVGLAATGTNFVQGVTFVNFGTGITLNSLSITDATDAVANITISNTTTVGYRNLTMVTGGEYATSSSTAFQVLANNAAVVGVSPNIAPQGFSGPLSLTATGTHFLQNATTVSIGNVIVGDVQVTSPTTATVQVAVPASSALGPQNVTVSTGGEIATLANGFTITGSTPALLSVVPATGLQGQNNLNVIITGNAYTHFSSTGGASVLLDMTGLVTVNSLVVNSPNQVTANISISDTAPATTITARLTSFNAANQGTIFPFAFTITPSSAAIVSVVPSSVPQGGQVTLNVTGVNTIWNQAQTTSAFYPEPVPIPVVNELINVDQTHETLNISVPTNTPPGSYPFYIATGGQVVSSSINVYANTPTLMMTPANGLVPSSGSNSFPVTFNGQFTTFRQGSATLPNTLPVIAGEGVTLSNFIVTSPISATATLTIAAGAPVTSRLVTLTTGGQIVTTYFNVTSTPIGLISIAPDHAAQSVTLDVAITGLNTHFTAGTTTVLFGPEITVNSISVADTTHLTANITTSFLFNSAVTPTRPGWQTVYVNTGTEQLLGGFRVDPPASPTMLSVVPSSAPQGSTGNVTITGLLTNWCGTSLTCPNPTEAILGAGVMVSNLAITSATTATATISVSPTAPVGGNSVTMITGSQIVGGTGFSVTPSAAYIANVGPAITCDANAEVLIANYCGTASGTPWVVSQLHTTTLKVVGVGTHWLQGGTSFNFGPGVVVDQLTIADPLHATVQITVLSNSPVGYAALTTYTGGESVTLQQAIDIEEGFPKLLAISPNSGEQGATMTLQVLGRFTSWVQHTPAQAGDTSLSFSGNPGITVNSINVIDNDNLTASITVDPLAYVDWASPCSHVLTVTTGTNEQVSTAPILDNFCVQQGAAQINSVSSLTGLPGTTGTITITGSATHFSQGVTTVSMGDSNFSVPTADIVVIDATHLTATIGIATSATPGFKTVTVSTYGETASKQFAYTVLPNQATLTEANPNQAQQGSPLATQPPLVVKLTGQYSHFDHLSTATFGAGIVVNSVAYVSATEVDATITIDPLSYTGGRVVTVTTPDVPCSAMVADVTNRCPGGATTGTGKEIVSASAFSIIPGPAIITQVAPNTGNEGQEVVLQVTGANTHWQQNFTQFYIAGGGYDLTINSVIINSATSATVDMNISPTANPGARSIYMVTAGESLTDSGAFIVTGGVPAIAYVHPGSALQGTAPLQVKIHGIYTKWDGSSTISFGPGITVSSYQVDDNSNIEAVISIAANAQPGYRTVAVTTGTQVLTGNFQVTAPGPPPTPYIWYYWPSSGLPGQTFNISFSGVNTHWDPNPTTGTQCSFGSGIQVNSCQVLGTTSILANITITATAAQSNLVVFTTGTETESTHFSVVVAQPVLSVVDPGSGLQGATNINVNILGQYTTFDATTTFSFGSGITVNGPPVILGPTIATQSISVNQLAVLGGRSVVATTPDALPIAQTVSGAGFSVTPSLALIAAITPNIAKQGATITVDVTGQNTHWDGSTVFQLGAGISVTNTQVNSPTDATLILSIPALASEGPTYASAITGGEVASIGNGFVVQAGTPYLLTSGPSSLQQQSAATFTILAQQTSWTAAAPPTVSYGAGVNIGAVQVTSPQSLTVTGSVQATTYVGWRNLTVTNGAQVLGLNNAFYVSPGPAVINSVVANSGGQGVTLPAVQINGTNTNWVQGVTTLTFPGVLVNSFTVNSPNLITANITVSNYAAAGQVSVTATTLGEVATGVNVFTIIQTQPELLAVVPSSGAQGVTKAVVLTGAFTHFTTAGSVPNFGAGITVNSVSASSATSLTANITVQPTATLGWRNVTVTTGTEVVFLPSAFNVLSGPAAISALSPSTGGQNTSMTIQVTGSQTHFNSIPANGAITQASFDGGIQVTGVTVVDALHANVNITIPNGITLGSYNVSLTTGGEVATILGGFTVSSGNPVVSAVSPPTGTQGIIQNVTITGLFTHFSSSSVVSFGPGITVNYPLTNVTNTHVTANITIATTTTVGSRNVTVVTGGETASITGGFSVLTGVPALVSAAPSAAQAGTSANIVINGVFTTFQQGFSTVSFGSGITVNFVSNVTTTQLTANITVASNATVGSRDISVTTNGQTQTLSGGFTVTAGTPIITQISPNFGNPGQTLSVTITGQYTNWVNGTTKAAFGSGIVTNSTTVSSLTSLTASITIPTATALGPANVTTTTGGQVESVPAGFTVQPVVIPAPSLFLLSPSPNIADMPINSNIIAVFSQPMDRTTINNSSVTLQLVSNQGQGWINIPGDVVVDAAGRVMTFTPKNLLAVNGQFYFTLSNAIKDATGNTFPNYNQWMYTAFSANTTPPAVVAANPPANSTAIGTNVIPQLEFSVPMNQQTEAGMTVTTSGNPVAGTFSWNSNPYGSGGWRPGTILSFTPTSPLLPNTTYKVSYTSTLADTAGNSLAPGSFLFTTGTGADSAQNYSNADFANGITNVGTNFAPRMNYSKPINPIGINTGTLYLYNGDSGKYIGGTVTPAPDGMSATFKPNVPLLPNTYYRFYQAAGNYDVDGNYLSGVNDYFTTGSGQDLVAPSVSAISPANSATGIPLNAEVIVHFNSPIDPNTVSNSVTLTPSGGSPVAGTATLASDMVTLFFVPTSSGGTYDSVLLPNTTYNIQVSGYSDLVGNAGTSFTSSFKTTATSASIILSTGLNASGNLITTGNTPDAHWVVVPTSSSAQGLFAATASTTPPATGPAQPLLVVAPGQSGFYSGWPGNGPSSSWVNIDPASSSGNTYGVYSTTFNITGAVPSNLCLVGAMGVDDNGILGLNGTAIMGNVSAINSLTQLNIPVSNYLKTGANSLSLAWGSSDNSYEAFRLQAVIHTCGASLGNSLTLTSAAPAYAAGSVATNTNIQLTFNNPIDPATVNSTSLPVMIGWNSNAEIAGNYTVAGNVVTFTPASPFPTNTQIWVGAYNGPYDLAGDSAANGVNSYTQLTYFNTGGTATPAATPFQIIAFSPSANATNVGLRAPVAATFNRSLNLNSVNANDYALFANDGNNPTANPPQTGPWCSGGSYSHSQDGTTILFNCGILPSSSTMTAVLGTGLSDWQGNGLASNYTSQFTTTYYDSNTNGSIISYRPGNGAGGVSPNLPLVLYSNLPVTQSSAANGLQVAQNDVALPGTVTVTNGGYTIVFTPSSPYLPGALIQWWTTGALTDTLYNQPVNSASGYFYVAASTSTLAPAFQIVSPANGATIPLNSIFDAQFNTPLNPSTVNATNIYLFDSHTSLHVPATITMPQPNEVRLVPTGPISPSSYIYLYITTGLQSATSVPVASTAYQYFYTGTTNDTSLPLIVSAVPYNGATGVAVNAAPGVVFNKAVDPASLNSSTFTVTNGGSPLAGSYWFSTGDTRVEFVPDTPLPASTPLVMTLHGVLDQEGNPINFSSNFTTATGPSFTRPSVLWSTVANNESVPTNAAITIQFSTSMDVTTFGSNDFYIQDALLNTPITTALSWNSSQSVAYLVPSTPLSAGRTYYLYVNTGTDLAGNPMNSYSATFYAEFAGASSAPTVIAFNPLNGQTGVGTNAVLEAQFSAPIDPTTISGVTLKSGSTVVPTSPTMSAGNSILQLVPQSILAPGTSYTITVAGVRDPAGNTVATAATSFTTGATYDLAAATATLSDPAYNSTVGTNITPKLVFNKPLNPTTVNNSTFRMYLVDTGQWIPLTVTESTNGTTVTMVPQIPLLPNTRYHFQACCGYQDQNGNNGNQVDEYFWTNGGIAASGDLTVSVSPLNLATGIPLNAQVIVATSVPVDPTTVGQNAIQLLNGANPVAGTVTAPSAQQINFAPTSALLPGTTYTVKVNNFKDANGNAVTPSTTTFTTGAAASTGGFTLSGESPSYGASGVSPAVTTTITLTFNQILDPATVNSNTLRVMNGWNSNYGLAGSWVINGNQAVFTPTSPYPPGGQIWVGTCNGPDDVLGDVYNNGSCWTQLTYFTVATGSPDTTPLTVVSVSPVNGATNVRPDSPVSVTFNKSINSNSVGSYNATLWAGQGLQDQGSVTMSGDGKTMTFSVGALYQGTTYTVLLPAGGISDPSGNTLATTFSSSFTVGTNPSTSNGTVVSPRPANNASGVPTNTLLTLYVSNPVNASTLAGNVVVTVNGAVYPGTLTAPANGYEVQFTPTTPFPNGATVQWWFSNVYDTTNVAFTSASGYFYTAPTTPNPATAQPTVVAVSPVYGTSTNVPTNTVINIEFNLPLDPTTVNSTNVAFYSGNNLTSVVTQPSPNVIRVTPSSTYTVNTAYYLCANSSVKGTNGVAIQGNCWTTYFTPTYGPDTTSGTVTVGPPNGAANIGTNAYLRLQFSKPLDQTSLTSTSVTITNTSTSATIPGTWSYNIVSGNVLGANFSPLNPLPPSTPIHIAVSGLKDYAGNSFNSPAVQFTTAALPDYSTPTVSLDFANGTAGIATNASFTCHYSEPMDPSSITPGGTYVYSYVTNAAIPVTYTFSTDMTSATMTPITPLFANSQYFYQCYSAIDLTGNAQSNGWASFSTGNGPSSAGPSLVYANPPNGSTNVPLNTNSGPWNSSSLDLLFNEPVAPESLANVTLTPQGGSPIPIAVYAQDGNFIASVALPWALRPNTQYTFNVAGVTDYNGTPAGAPLSSTFTTGSSLDITNPTITAATPANNATNVGVNAPLSITFSEAMNPTLLSTPQIYLRTHNTQTTVPTTLTISSDDKTVTLTPTTPLSASTIYDIVYWPNGWYLYDIAGNPDYSYGTQTTFTTGVFAAVNGVCGSANGASFSAPPPAANLCSAGAASAITNTGSWTWSCNGQYGGSNASCSATVAAGPACAAQPSGLVSWWKGNNDATDHMGLNNGTLINGASFALGESGDAFSLSGSNQYVLIGQPVPVSLQIQNAITLSAWIYPTAFPVDNGAGALGMIAGSQVDGAYGGTTIFFDARTNPDGYTGVPSGHIHFQIGDGTQWHSTDTTTQLPLNQWTLVTATRVAGGPPIVYYNGVSQPLQTGAAWNGTISYPSGDWFAIGQEVNENRPFTGSIDEVQVYNKALTAAQIQGIYNAGSTGVCP